MMCVYHLADAQIIKEDTTTNGPFFAAKKFDSKCFVGIEGVPTQILKTKAAMNLGLNLNWVINHTYVVSAKYHVLTTPVDIKSRVAPSRTDSVLLQHHFAGLGFSYIFFHNKKFSLQPELTVGWSSAKYTIGATHRHDLAAFIPAVYGIYNATKYFRFGVGLNYRATVGGSFDGISNVDLCGAGGVVFIRVGTF